MFVNSSHFCLKRKYTHEEDEVEDKHKDLDDPGTTFYGHSDGVLVLLLPTEKFQSWKEKQNQTIINLGNLNNE